MRRSRILAGAAVLGSTAMILSLAIPARSQVPFPVLPFLRFDPSEIPDFIAFLVFGPIAGVLTAMIHYLLLLAQTSRGPLGPTLKFAGVISSMLGLWLGSAVIDRAFKRTSALTAYGSMFVFAAISRLAFTTVLNFFVFTSLGPLFGIDYMGTSQKALKISLGLDLASGTDVLIYSLALTGVYNLMQLAVSTVPSFALISPLVVKVPELASGNTWIARYAARAFTRQTPESKL